MTGKLFNGCPIDLTADEARAALDAVTEEARVVNKYGSEELHIMHNGQWHHLCRTDLADDVCTWHPDRDQSIAYYRERIWAGARVGWYDGKPVPDGETPRFAVIDSWSDG